MIVVKSNNTVLKEVMFVLLCIRRVQLSHYIYTQQSRVLRIREQHACSSGLGDGGLKPALSKSRRYSSTYPCVLLDGGKYTGRVVIDNDWDTPLR